MGSGVSGRRTGVTERLRQPDATLAERNVQYTYDQLNRLTEEASTSTHAEANFTTDYVYDLVGNRLAKGTSRNQDGIAENIGYAFNANDQLLTEISSTKGQTDYTYSLNGELISKIEPDASYAYSYNLDDRLSGATINRVEKDTWGTSHNIAISATYQYDQNGIRTRATSTTSINTQPGYTTDRVFLVDSANHTGYAQVLEEFAGLNYTPVKSYVLGDDVLADTGKYLLYDGHGSTRMLADSAGTVTDRYSFDAYGQMLGGNPNITNPASTDLTYSGEQFDPGLQMNYHRARYYDMGAGVWNRLDPFSGNHSDPQSLHKYAYCHGDPVNGWDPSGLFTLVEMLCAVVIVTDLVSLTAVPIFASRRRAQNSVAMMAATRHPLYYVIDRIFRNLIAYNISIPPAMPEVVTWNVARVLLIQAIGRQLADIGGGPRLSLVDLDTTFHFEYVNIPVEQREPKVKRSNFSRDATLFIHFVPRKYTVISYVPSGNASGPSVTYTWEGALAHELMHAYRQISGTHTGNDSIEDYAIAQRIGLRYSTL